MTSYADMKRGRKIFFALAVFLLFFVAAIFVFSLVSTDGASGPPDTPGFYRPGSYPGLVYELTPGMTGTLEGVSARINSRGLRGVAPKVAKDPGVVRVVILGDSIVFGHGIEEDFTVSVLLEKRLVARSPGTEWEVVNGGVSGHNMTDYAIIFKPRILTLDPDVLVLFITEINDPERKHFVPRSETIDGWKKSWWANRSFIKPFLAVPLAEEINRVFLIHVSEIYDPNGEHWPLFVKDLEDMIDACEEKGARMIVVSYPYIDDEDVFSKERAQLHKLIDRLGVTRVDPLPEFHKHKARDLVVNKGDFHPNEKANAIMADLLVDPILEKTNGAKK